MIERLIRRSLKLKSGLPDDTITRKVLEEKTPTIDDVRDSLGDDEQILKSFYIALILLDNISRREGKKPYFTHSYSVAAKPDYRYYDPELPSGFRQNAFEKSLGLIHDLREEFGKNIAGSYVVGDYIRFTLGDELAEGLEDLTNSNELVMRSIEKQLESLKITDRERYKRLEADDISRRLKNELEKLKIDERVVMSHYIRIERALRNFVGYHPELNDDIKDFIYVNFIAPLKTLKVEGGLFPDKINESVRMDFGHVIDIVDKGILFEADQKLIHGSESPYLVTLNKTLYDDGINNNVMEKGYRNVKDGLAEGKLSAHCLSVPIVKVSDSIATIATLEADIVHAIHQFRKARRVYDRGGALTNRLYNEGVDSQIYQRLERAIDYLHRNLVWSLKEHYESFTKKGKRDTTYKEDVKLLEYMLGKEGIKPPKPPIVSFRGFRVI